MYKIPDETRSKVLQDYLNGNSSSSIINKYNISHSSLSRITRNNLDVQQHRLNRCKSSPYIKQQAKNLYLSKVPVNEICKELNISQKTFQRLKDQEMKDFTLEYRKGCSYEDLIIYKSGKIKDKNKNAYKKPSHVNGYLGIWINGTYEYVHRLVATKFIPNPDNKPYVNHKDGNRHNNKVSNLEWVSAKENYDHANEVLKVIVPYKPYGKDNAMSKGFIDITTGVQYESKGDYARKHGLHPSTVAKKIKNGALAVRYLDEKK